MRIAAAGSSTTLRYRRPRPKRDIPASTAATAPVIAARCSASIGTPMTNVAPSSFEVRQGARARGRSPGRPAQVAHLGRDGRRSRAGPGRLHVGPHRLAIDPVDHHVAAHARRRGLGVLVQPRRVRRRHRRHRVHLGNRVAQRLHQLGAAPLVVARVGHLDDDDVAPAQRLRREGSVGDPEDPADRGCRAARGSRPGAPRPPAPQPAGPRRGPARSRRPRRSAFRRRSRPSRPTGRAETVPRPPRRRRCAARQEKPRP